MSERFRWFARKCLVCFWISVMGLGLTASPARSDNEFVTVPVIVADYYVWAYWEVFQDRADVFGFTTAGVDALGWTLIISAQSEAGLKLVNAAGIAKTVYPVVAVLWASDPAVRERAWIALGTHTVSLLTLELLGRPAIRIQAQAPRPDSFGVAVAYNF
jgi:hypothetical protein